MRPWTPQAGSWTCKPSWRGLFQRRALRSLVSTGLRGGDVSADSQSRLPSRTPRVESHTLCSPGTSRLRQPHERQTRAGSRGSKALEERPVTGHETFLQMTGRAGAGDSPLCSQSAIQGNGDSPGAPHKATTIILVLQMSKPGHKEDK